MYAHFVKEKKKKHHNYLIIQLLEKDTIVIISHKFEFILIIYEKHTIRIRYRHHMERCNNFYIYTNRQ